ncbi:TPA: hypothetical protein VDU92_005410, partial [Pseudomonas aeruginosa]|nr:phosphate starvation-inducible protein [Pseudomonas aeruginosa]HDL4928378.1 hypothetical protein [Pseudomonas aeruginosa]HEP8980035.1 hypothetical protein [Pseudomonas aeruginosa]
MNILRIPMFVLAMAVSAHGFAATAQQEKMTACNAEATTKALKGDERKAFMSGCLKAGAPAGGKATAQQEKMKSCNADASAKSLKGDERKAFMSSCLKAGGSAKAATQQEKMKTCNADAT